VTPDEHRALGVELDNRTWELLDRRAAPDVIVHTAHASAYLDDLAELEAQFADIVP
jgi:hypothetical protein